MSEWSTVFRDAVVVTAVPDRSPVHGCPPQGRTLHYD